MIYQIIDILKQTALYHKNVYTFKYQDKLLINAQPNNNYYEVIIETDPLLQSLGDNNRLTLNMTILGFGDQLEVQDIAAQIGLSIINKAVTDFPNILSLENYEMLFISRTTDDRSSGVRITINFIVPSFIDYCKEPKQFLTQEEYERKIEQPEEIDLGYQSPPSVLILRP